MKCEVCEVRKPKSEMYQAFWERKYSPRFRYFCSFLHWREWLAGKLPLEAPIGLREPSSH